MIHQHRYIQVIAISELLRSLSLLEHLEHKNES